MRLVVVAVDYVVFCFCFMKIKCVYGEEKKEIWKRLLKSILPFPSASGDPLMVLVGTSMAPGLEFRLLCLLAV